MKTALYKRANEKSMLEHELIRLDRFSIAGQLASALANEINSPLQSVTTLLKTMEIRYKDKDPRIIEDLELMGNVFNNFDYSLKIFQDLNKPALMLKIPSNINIILEKTVNLIRTNLSKNLIEVTMHFDRNIPEIEVSEQHFTQLFLNVLNNAIESITRTAPEAAYVIDDDETLTPVGTINIRTDYTDNAIVIQITDTGEGIPEALLPNQIFDMFITERRTRGMGIGLAICKTIVQDYNGKIEACNSDATGAVISITIPAD
jgi:signal transduction histidine kinase